MMSLMWMNYMRMRSRKQQQEQKRQSSTKNKVFSIAFQFDRALLGPLLENEDLKPLPRVRRKTFANSCLPIYHT